MNDLKPVFSVLPKDDVSALQGISSGLSNAWSKAQVFRTDTEARVSVLNDGKHPTLASKYWQAVREQTVMLDNLTQMSFDLRRNDVDLKRAKKLANSSSDDLDKEAAQIDYDECLWKKASLEKVAHDRVREILMWEKIKLELDDGSFDTENVNAHQADSMNKQLKFRRDCLSSTSSPDDVRNVLGPLKTLERANETGELKLEAKVDTSKPNARIN